MASDAKGKALAAAKRAQADFEREQKRLLDARAKSRAKRRERFTAAQSAGLSLREIGQATDLHPTRVREILRES